MSHIVKQLIEKDSGYRRVKFNPYKKGYFIDKTVRLSGITKKLQECFWPEYKLKTKAATQKERLDMSFTVGKPFDSVTESDGRVRGKIIHKEIEEYTNRKNSTLQEFKEYKEKIIGDPLHSVTYFTIYTLEKEGLIPIFSELRVGSAESKLGTAIDIVCTNEKNEVCLVEFKSGFAGVFETGDHQMERILFKNGQVVTDCPANQAVIQLAVTAMLYEKTFTDLVKPTKFYVVNVNERESAKVYRLIEDGSLLFEHRQEIFDIFLDFLKRQADDRAIRRSLGKGSKRKKESK